jgi:hypothetical protein
MNAALAYLILGCGTDRGNRVTAWSTTAVSKWGGLGVERAKAAIQLLIRDGFTRHADWHTPQKPRYELILPGQKSKDEDDDGERIWLPNTLVTGTKSGEVSPVQRLRGAGDEWALRLLVDLYHAQNLRDDGGISPLVLRQKFTRERIAEQGIYSVWGFKVGDLSGSWTGPFAPHKGRRKTKGQSDEPLWDSVGLLHRMGLLTYVPHLFENDSQESEAMHPFGFGERGEEPIESEIGEAADGAAREMAGWHVERAEQNGFEHFCPVVQTLPKVEMIGVARLLYRPHTRRTAAWFGQLQENGRNWLKHYRELAAKVTPAQRNMGNYG